MRPAIVALAAVVAATGCGRQQWRDVDRRLNAAAAGLRADGFEPLAGPYNSFGTFAEPGSHEWTIALEAGRRYALVAACAAPCRDLDFTLAAPDGAVLDDTTSGSTALLVFEPASGGRHAVRFRYGDCGTGRCYWAAQIYRRPD